MAGTSRYERAKELLDNLKSEGKKLLTEIELKYFIITNFGSDEVRTVKPYIDMMVETKLIKAQGDGYLIC